MTAYVLSAEHVRNLAGFGSIRDGQSKFECMSRTDAAKEKLKSEHLSTTEHSSTSVSQPCTLTHAAVRSAVAGSPASRRASRTPSMALIHEAEVVDRPQRRAPPHTGARSPADRTRVQREAADPAAHRAVTVSRCELHVTHSVHRSDLPRATPLGCYPKLIPICGTTHWRQRLLLHLSLVLTASLLMYRQRGFVVLYERLLCNGVELWCHCAWIHGQCVARRPHLPSAAFDAGGRPRLRAAAARRRARAPLCHLPVGLAAGARHAACVRGRHDSCAPLLLVKSTARLISRVDAHPSSLAGRS